MFNYRFVYLVLIERYFNTYIYKTKNIAFHLALVKQQSLSRLLFRVVISVLTD